MRFAAAALLLCPALAFAQAFHVEESTIESTQRAIQRGETTCREVIAGYIERARAYNGVCTALVTRDGAPVAPASGPVRAGAPLEYPTQTVAVDTLLPNYADYAGKPVELGRMEASQSDPDAQLQRQPNNRRQPSHLRHSQRLRSRLPQRRSRRSRRPPPRCRPRRKRRNLRSARRARAALDATINGCEAARRGR